MKKFEIMRTLINNLSTSKYIFITSVLAYIAVAIFVWIKHSFSIFPEVNLAMQEKSMGFIFGDFIIIKPIIESAFILFEVRVLRRFIKNKWQLLIIATIIYCLCHYENSMYPFPMIIPALIYVYSYVIRIYKGIHPVYVMTFIHMLFDFYRFAQVIIREV